jgi:hypothetical protein
MARATLLLFLAQTSLCLAAGSHPPARAEHKDAASTVVSSLASVAKSVVVPVGAGLSAGWDKAKHVAGVLHNITLGRPDASTKGGHIEPGRGHDDGAGSRPPSRVVSRRPPDRPLSSGKAASSPHAEHAKTKDADARNRTAPKEVVFKVMVMPPPPPPSLPPSPAPAAPTTPRAMGDDRAGNTTNASSSPNATSEATVRRRA